LANRPSPKTGSHFSARFRCGKQRKKKKGKGGRGKKKLAPIVGACKTVAKKAVRALFVVSKTKLEPLNKKKGLGI